MREIRPSGSEGGARSIPCPYPYHFCRKSHCLPSKYLRSADSAMPRCFVRKVQSERNHR